MSFALALSFSCHAWAAPQRNFADAVKDAKNQGLTTVNRPSQGVPFYSMKTLDPNWGEPGSAPIVRLSNFSLIDQNGAVRDASLLSGKITIVALFFSTCAGFCPTLVKNLQRVESALSKRHGDIQYVGISINPENDSVNVLKAYAKKMRLSRSWVLLTGDEKQISSIVHDTFAAEAFRLPKSKGQFGHTEHFFILDGQARLRGVLKGTRLDVSERASQLIAALKSAPDA